MPEKINPYDHQSRFQNGCQRAKTCRSGSRKAHYFTTGRPISEKALKDMEAEILKPYGGALDLNSMESVKKYWENEKNKKMEERKANYANHHTYRSRVNLLWKSERLFVPDDVKLPGGSLVEDIDPNFFKIITGRPIREKKDLREYLKDIRECFLTRLKTGYCFDEILLMDERHINEMRGLWRAKKGFLSTLKGFETFLAEDYFSSLSLLEAAKEGGRQSQQKLETINALKEELRNLEADVTVVHEEWSNLRVLQKFLYRISPTEWRRNHDPYYGKDDDRVMSSDRCLPNGGEFGLQVIIKKFQEDIAQSQPPALYFTEPQEIINIFLDLEKNNLRALTHCVDLDFPAEETMAELERKKAQFAQEQTNLQEEIQYLRNMVEDHERNFRGNESDMKKIAFGLFRDLITNEDLAAAALVEDAYEDAVAPSDGSLDLLAMMKEIELKHESLLMALDKLPNDIVTRTVKHFYRTQRRELKEAKEADKKVRQMELLLKRLSKALSYPRKGVRERKILPRSQPPEEVMFGFKLPKIPSKEEREEASSSGGHQTKSGCTDRCACEGMPTENGFAVVDAVPEQCR